MHLFLRSIGFRNITKDKLNEILKDISYNPEHMEVTIDSEGNQFVELRTDVAKGMGLSLRGAFESDDEFRMDYYFPYFTADSISTNCEVEIVRQSDRESYQGMCDDIRIGIDLVFYLQNMFTLLQSDQRNNKIVDFGGVRLSGLASDGVILLPVAKKQERKENVEKKIRERNDLILAARNGDPQAMEKLTLEDMDTYSLIQKRLEKEDVLSIVTTYVMPNGIECDKYQILGEIIGYRNVVNKFTMELVHLMTVECNRMKIEVAVNDRDLLGEPEVGRRFKGNIWLQGKVG